MILAGEHSPETISWLSRFFGTPTEEINLLAGLIALQSAEAPVWLRGKPEFSDLPRVGSEPFAHTVAVPPIARSEYAERVRWIIEHLRAGWYLDQDGFSFERYGDARDYEAQFG